VESTQIKPPPITASSSDLLLKHYNFSECMEIVTATEGVSGIVYECVTGITILEDGSLQVWFSWRAHLAKGSRIEKGSDAGNINIYLADDLGNRYDHFRTGGYASEQVYLYDGQTVSGWFLFPALAPDARYIIFHDDDNTVQTGPLQRLWP
jgi:hypothetical protein